MVSSFLELLCEKKLFQIHPAETNRGDGCSQNHDKDTIFRTEWKDCDKCHTSIIYINNLD